MKLFAISDLHVGSTENRRFLAKMSAHPSDWLILGGDLGESEEDLRFVFETLGPRFAKLIWIPGNHELWGLSERGEMFGVNKYEHFVKVCRSYGVLTPEDPYPEWPGEGPPTIIVPMFLLYDYSFRPPEVSAEGAVAWAAETDIQCADESLLLPNPYPSRSAWCAARCDWTAQRLDQIDPKYQTVLINHYPMLYEHVFIPRIPRFSIWCGTTRTKDWHLKYRARAVVYGHLHLRVSEFRDGVWFDEVSMGYPRQRSPENSVDHYVREILPRHDAVPGPRRFIW